MEAKKLLKDKKLWFASFLIAWAAALQHSGVVAKVLELTETSSRFHLLYPNYSNPWKMVSDSTVLEVIRARGVVELWKARVLAKNPVQREMLHECKPPCFYRDNLIHGAPANPRRHANARRSDLVTLIDNNHKGIVA
ncbi:unnamed protein product [Dovyalis caffra]|uniref:Uncharacterized protein n=1 Tax=Dovyalis caffra TaxID=77055 RepID=A0AAV1QYE6_9ROSI|nr:unnamed protein product [Dovyalis caffra]